MHSTNKLDAAPAGENLSGHVVVVTGGSRGIGKAIASRLAQLGAAVSLCARNAKALETTAAELSANGATVRSQAVDVTNARDVASFIEATEKELGPITILVNNAGIGGPGFGPVHEKSEDDWQRVLDTNLKSVFLVSKAVAPSMIARGRGDIVNISSLAGKNTFAGGGIYCASKWGLQGLAGCMAEDLRAFGIRVSLVCPGSVATEFSGRRLKDPAKALTPEDVAHAVSMIVLQGPQSFLSEVHLRPVAKP
jgi:NAD(P)-dependent dehydrogenase (short-subunit alcohol dehydrogenase family)